MSASTRGAQSTSCIVYNIRRRGVLRDSRQRARRIYKLGVLLVLQYCMHDIRIRARVTMSRMMRLAGDLRRMDAAAPWLAGWLEALELCHAKVHVCLVHHHCVHPGDAGKTWADARVCERVAYFGRKMYTGFRNEISDINTYSAFSSLWWKTSPHKFRNTNKFQHTKSMVWYILHIYKKYYTDNWHRNILSQETLKETKSLWKTKLKKCDLTQLFCNFIKCIKDFLLKSIRY